jgi:hypothetical protein
LKCPLHLVFRMQTSAVVAKRVSECSLGNIIAEIAVKQFVPSAPPQKFLYRTMATLTPSESATNVQ